MSAVLNLIAEYTSGTSFQAFLRNLEDMHPLAFGLIDPKYQGDPDFDGFAECMNRVSWEFEATGDGRGSSYNLAQHQFDRNRAKGMARLLDLATRNGPRVAGRGFVLLDALAGDGTVSRFASTLSGSSELNIISADISSYMIDCCVRQGLPCVRQSATQSLMRDDVLDAVMIAYGTHHIPPAERAVAIAEARRTIGPGGRLVVHDFEVGSVMDVWFKEVVHPYSMTGHAHDHFTAEDFENYFATAGFDNVEILRFRDPFEAVGESEHTARRGLVEFLHAMYGLDRLPLRCDADYAALEAQIDRIFGGIEIELQGGLYLARAARDAIVATATK
ncbi:MAG: methyltransferase domain-containing protein [Sphingomonadales bacterium]|nr:methyltransferase domain-containing protein [Sphingomonadales bacterium]